MPPSPDNVEVTARQRWMAVLARASGEALNEAWASVQPAPAYQWLRPAESGLMMVRGRIGGSGDRFNVGEASITRCAVRTDDGYVGMSYVLGRDKRHAELAALFDALLQDPQRREAIQDAVIEPLITAQHARREVTGRKAAATKVEFYTLARGDED